MPAIVHTTAFNATSGTIPATTAGNCLVVCITSTNSGTTAASVTGVTLGGSADNFASATAAHGTNGFTAVGDAFQWVDPNCAGGQTAIAISGANLNLASGNGEVVVYEISGIVASSPVDKTSTGNSTGSSWSSGATAATTVAAEAWIGCAAVPSPAGPGAPWNNTTSGTAGIAGQQVVASTGTATYSGTGTSAPWAAVVLTLKGATGSSGTVQPTTATPAPRRPRRRAVVTFTPVKTTNAAPTPPVSGTVQPITATPAPRRPRRRAVVTFTPVSTTNAAPPRVAGTIQPRPTLTPPRRPRRRAVVTFTPVKTTNARRQLIIALASQAGTDDYGNTFPQGILATEGTIEGPEIIGSDAFFYSSRTLGGLITSITEADGTDAYGNAFIAGTASYHDSGLGFVSAVVIDAGVITWYKATTFAGPWTAEAGIGFSWNNITGGGLAITATAGISGSFNIPQPSPAANSAAIISALFAAGIFN